MDKADIKKAIDEYVKAADLAVNEAGFGEHSTRPGQGVGCLKVQWQMSAPMEWNIP